MCLFFVGATIGLYNRQQFCLADAKCDTIASEVFRNVHWFHSNILKWWEAMMQAALAAHDMSYQYLLSQGIVYKSAKWESFWTAIQNDSPHQKNLHCLVYHTAYGIRCLPFHPLGGVGIGIQREARTVMP